MRVFLTGATGFIGRNIKETLEKEGHIVIPHSLSLQGKLIEIPAEVDIAVNSAGRLGGQGYSEDELKEANLNIPLKVAALCARRNIPLVHMSTPGVCGLQAGGRETDEYRPEGLYEETKRDAEELLLDILPGVTILRPDFVFGRGDMHKYDLFRQVSRGWFPLVGRGNARTRPTDVRDVSRAVKEALPGGPLHRGIFNIAGPQILTVREIALEIAAAAGRKTVLISVPRLFFKTALKLGPLCPRALSKSRYRLFGTDRFTDISKAANAGFHPIYSFRDTAAAAVNWYRKRGLL